LVVSGRESKKGATGRLNGYVRTGRREQRRGRESARPRRGLPGFDTVTRAAFVPEGAVRYLQRCGHENAQAITAEDIAAQLRQCLKARAEWA